MTTNSKWSQQKCILKPGQASPICTETLSDHAVIFVWIIWMANRTLLVMIGLHLVTVAWNWWQGWAKLWLMTKIHCRNAFWNLVKHPPSVEKLSPTMQSSLYGSYEWQTELYWWWLGCIWSQWHGIGAKDGLNYDYKFEMISAEMHFETWSSIPHLYRNSLRPCSHLCMDHMNGK